AQAERIARAAQPYGVALVTPGSLAVRPAGDQVFSLDVSPARQAWVLASFLTEELKATRVSVLAEQGDAVAAAVAAAFKELTRNKVHPEEGKYSGKPTDPELVARAQRFAPQAVLVTGGTSLDELWPEFRKAVPKAALVFGGDSEVRAALLDEPAANEG